MVTIQINSQAALERLIGGDSKLAIEARNSIIQNFTQKHLKSLVSLDVVQNEAQKLRKDFNILVAERISQEIGIIKTNHYGTVTECKLKPEIEALLKNSIDAFVSELIRKTIEKKIESLDIEKLINTAVNSAVDYRIKQGVKKRFDELVQTI